MSETKSLSDERRTLHIVDPSPVAFGNVKAPEPFVSAEEAARFLSVKRRYLLALARMGIAGAYAIGTGTMRKVWVFRLSELSTAIANRNTPISKPPKSVTIRSGSLHAEKRNN